MSAFDDEFGLFGEESVEIERRPTLGARKIAASETVIDEIEPEDDQPRRVAIGPPSRERDRRRRDEPATFRAILGPGTGGRARYSVSLRANSWRIPKPSAVELFVDEHAQPVIELVVSPDDLGKVIGRNGRVAHALRTLVRATAEGRVSVDILDSEEAAEPLEGDDRPDGE